MALLSTPQTTQQIPVGFNPQQTAAMNQLLSLSTGGLQSLLGNMGGQAPSASQAQVSPVSFEPIAQQARQQFHQQTVPSIAERFTAMGAGAQRSSAFPQLLGGAGADLESRLAALGSQFGLEQQRLGLQERGLGLQERGLGLQERGQTLGALQNLLGVGLTPQMQTQVVPAQRGELSRAGGRVGGALLSLLPMLLGGLFAGPAGAAGGAALGGGLRSLIS